jgi:peptidoglycan/xylan/chitin deacetylase (PgdA/CDA1 family)
MPTFKEIFFNISTPVAAVSSLRFLRAVTGIRRIVPVYHAVADEVPGYLRYLYRVQNTREFIKDLDGLLKYFKPVDLHELVDRHGSGKKKEEPVCHLTFDDGLKEFHEIVAPILLKKGIPATCFLNNAFIDNHDMLFRLKASLLIDHLHKQGPASSAWINFHDWVQKYHYGNTYYRKLLLSLKVNDTVKIDELASMLEISFPEFLKKYRPYMTSTMIRELIDKGFTFGAHTFSHVDFRDLDEKEQLEEIKKSIDDLEQRFDLKYRIFAFPFTDFGIKASLFRKLTDEAICSLTFGCAGIKKDMNPISIQRIPIESFTGGMKSILKKEYLYNTLLQMTGMGKMKR